MFTILTTLAVLMALLVLAWALWFVLEFIRYVASGDYQIDQRLQQIKR